MQASEALPTSQLASQATGDGGSAQRAAAGRPPLPWASRADRHDLLAAHLKLIDSVIAFVRRKNRLTCDEGEELASNVYLKLLEDDCTVLRQFRGESQLRTFLVVVVRRVLLDVRIAKWGKWHASATARRLGPIAVRLEQLTVRDGLRLNEAAECLRLEFGVADTDDELDFLLSLLPRRCRRRFVGLEELLTLPASGPGPERGLLRAQASQPMAALERAVAALGVDDRLLIEQRFREGLRVCEIARWRAIDPKRLHRRFEGVLKQLRTELQNQGITSADVSACLAMGQPDYPAVRAS